MAEKMNGNKWTLKKAAQTRRGRRRGRGAMFAFALILMLLAGPIYPGVAVGAAGDPDVFPRYGAGAVHVRLYTDYFCGPCRSIEPAAEALLRDQVKKKQISLTLVDTPLTRNSVLYARYFLFALKERNDLDHALTVRRLLFETAAAREPSSSERIESTYRSKNIPFAVFDPKPSFDRYNVLIREDNIQSTPTCIIVKAGRKERFVGTGEVIEALKKLP